MLQSARRSDTFVGPDSGESRGGKVARGRYPGVRGRGEERVHQSSPFCSKSRSRQRGGERRQVSPSHPFFLSPSPPLPSPPPPSPRISRPAREPPRRPGRLSPQFNATLPRPSPAATSLETFPRRCPSCPLPPSTLLSPASPARTSLRGGISKNHCFREMHLFVCTFPANQCEQPTLASSFCQFPIIRGDGTPRVGGQPHKIKAFTQSEVGRTLGSLPSSFLHWASPSSTQPPKQLKGGSEGFF